MITIQEQRKYPCDMCLLSFDSKHGLNTHKRVHGNSNLPFYPSRIKMKNFSINLVRVNPRLIKSSYFYE